MVWERSKDFEMVMLVRQIGQWPNGQIATQVGVKRGERYTGTVGLGFVSIIINKKLFQYTDTSKQSY